VVFKILIFPKIRRQIILKRNINTFLVFWTRQRLNLVLRILIQNEKSGLRSFLKDIWKTILEIVLVFWEVNLKRTSPAPMYLTVENH